MAATVEQVQAFADQRVRPHSEMARTLALMFSDDIAVIEDVYNALNVQSPEWSDSRTDGPPHLLTPADILAYNSFMHDIRDAIVNNAQYPVILKACVRPVTG